MNPLNVPALEVKAHVERDLVARFPSTKAEA